MLLRLHFVHTAAAAAATDAIDNGRINKIGEYNEVCVCRMSNWEAEKNKPQQVIKMYATFLLSDLHW